MGHIKVIMQKKPHKTTDFRKERLGDGNLITGETAETEAR